MIIFIFYIGTGIYFLLMSLGLLHRRFFAKIPQSTRLSVRFSLFFFGVGLFLSAVYQVYVYYVIRPALDL